MFSKKKKSKLLLQSGGTSNLYLKYNIYSLCCLSDPYRDNTLNSHTEERCKSTFYNWWNNFAQAQPLICILSIISIVFRIPNEMIHKNTHRRAVHNVQITRSTWLGLLGPFTLYHSGNSTNGVSSICRLQLYILNTWTLLLKWSKERSDNSTIQ